MIGILNFLHNIKAFYYFRILNSNDGELSFPGELKRFKENEVFQDLTKAQR
jgi:hypothetical protein